MVSVVTSGVVDTTTLGEYTVTYSATDTELNNHTLTRTITVVDTTAPVLSLVGDASITLEVGTAYVEQGTSVTDNLDSIINVVTSGVVDTTTLGEYTVTYSATDTVIAMPMQGPRSLIIMMAWSVL